MKGRQSLAIVGHLDVPVGVLHHRFVAEAQANAMLLQRNADVRRQVVGTENSQHCELYGWMASVDSHVDNSGWIYLVLLNEGKTTVQAYSQPHAKRPRVRSVDVPVGAVVRLWDHCLHWTIDSGYRVAAFVGSWPEPNDRVATELLREGIGALARGDYYGAPRVKEGFRAYQPDEGLAVCEGDVDRCEPVLLADAQRRGRFIQLCGQCDAPAVRLDDKWPYFNEFNRCRAHLAGETYDLSLEGM